MCVGRCPFPSRKCVQQHIVSESKKKKNQTQTKPVCWTQVNVCKWQAGLFVQGRNQGVALKITITWKTRSGADSKPTDLLGKMPGASEVAAGISHLTSEGFGSVPGKVTESKQTERKKEKISPVIWPSSSLSTILVSPQVCKQPAPTTRRELVFAGELRLHLLKISIERVLTSDSGKGTRLKKGCSKLSKAKLFACWLVGF